MTILYVRDHSEFREADVDEVLKRVRALLAQRFRAGSSALLNNLVEQVRRAIKSRVRPMLGFHSYPTAALTLMGIELVHRIRKRQFKCGPGPGRWSF